MIFFTRRFFTSSGTNIGNLDVGTEIILNENGAPVNYLIVNQGIPSNSSLYDASCNGVWILRKYTPNSQQMWNSSGTNAYGSSSINTYLNEEWLDRYDSNVLEAIVQAKIPYVNGTGNSPVASGENGLNVKAFLLSMYEVGIDQTYNQYVTVDGAKLEYFDAGTETVANSKRPTNRENGKDAYWFLRSPVTRDNVYAWMIVHTGKPSTVKSTDLYDIRPSIILPFDFKLSDSQIVA